MNLIGKLGREGGGGQFMTEEISSHRTPLFPNGKLENPGARGEDSSVWVPETLVSYNKKGLPHTGSMLMLSTQAKSHCGSVQRSHACMNHADREVPCLDKYLLGIL